MPLGQEDLDPGWKIELDAYTGPVDLLLYLIKRDEVDIYDIPIAHVTQQYVQYLDVLRRINLNLAGEFLVMAATLMEIKSKMLLPREEVNFDEIEDPRLELVQQLLEYRRFKDAARHLDDRASQRDQRFSRPFAGIDASRLPERDEEAADVDLPEDVSLWDLVGALAKVLQETRLLEPHMAPGDTRPLREYRIDLLALIRELGQVSFSAIFEDLSDRLAVISMFLALLELIRMKRARARQSDEFGEIVITLGELGHVDIPPSAEAELEARAAPTTAEPAPQPSEATQNHPGEPAEPEEPVDEADEIDAATEPTEEPERRLDTTDHTDGDVTAGPAEPLPEAPSEPPASDAAPRAEPAEDLSSIKAEPAPADDQPDDQTP